MPMHIPTPEELAFARAQRVGRLATITPDGRPAVVPVCFTIVDSERGPEIVSVLDAKPKQVAVTDLGRVRNILVDPRVCLTVDRYSEDWTALAWVQLHGRAAVLDGGSDDALDAIEALRDEYPQYRSMPLADAPVIAIGELTATSWSWTGSLQSGAPRADDLDSVVRGRRSVRSFLPERVPAPVIRSAIEAAGWAPSPHGRQPWRFVVVERPERRAGLAEAMAATWDAQLRLDGQDDEIVHIRLEKSRQRLIEAPVLVVPCLYLADLDVYPDVERQAAEEVMAIQSLGSAIQNFLLTIYAAGFDAGWMCAPLFCQDVVRAELGLDDALIPHALLPVGRSAKDPVRRPRLPVDDLIVRWD